MVKLIAKWYKASKGRVSGDPKSHLRGSVGQIGKYIIVNMLIFSEMVIGLTLNFADILNINLTNSAFFLKIVFQGGPSCHKRPQNVQNKRFCAIFLA